MIMTESTNGYHNSQWSVPGETPSAFGYNGIPGQQPMSPHKRDSTSSSPRHSVSNGYSSDQHSDTEDGPTYLLEHLATFTVGRTHSIMDPTDGLNRLWQMERRTGIWTQKMQMRLLKQQVVIIDFENGDVVERFPMNLINSPMAYTGTDSREPYNNILVFIVKEDPKAKSLNNSEMHIFQCVQVSAQIIVDDMKLFMAGKWKSPNRLPPPPSSPAPEPPRNGVNQAAMFHAPGPNPNMLRSSPAFNTRDSIDETSSTSSEKYEKEVGILNHCFDDIEQFIAWLQSAAAAYRELERRRKDRKNKKKNDHGDGMLRMRAKPPPEHDFVDVLQKFKLSFNLLAKLKNHIHDPNAPELVHFLFTPLALIVDASQDSNYGSNLASKVVAPLLTKEAVELLGNCLTSKESDLWHSLGEAWVVPREQWKGFVEPYRPVFRDGYSPDYPFSEDKLRAEVTATAAAAAAKARLVHQEMELREYQQTEHDGRNSYPGHPYNGEPADHPSSPDDRRRVPYLPRGRDLRYGDPRANSPHSEQEYVTSDISLDSIERTPMDPQRDFERHQQQWLEDLKARRAKIVQVIFPRTANNDKELSVYRGEYLEILDDNRRWWKARNYRDQVAHVPHTIVTPYHLDDEVVFSNPLYDGPGREMYRQESRLSTDGGSTSGDVHTSRPASIPPPPTPLPAQPPWRPVEKPVLKEPPPVEPKPVKPAPPKNQSPVFDPESSDKLHDELKRTIGRSEYKKRGVTKPKLPPMLLNEASTDEDVQMFLRTKGFDKSIQHILSEMDGLKLFHLTKPQMEKYCGKEEGVRLYSQLELQKSLSGYCTMRFKELPKILKKRKEKVEGQENFGTIDENQNDDDEKVELRSKKSHSPPRPTSNRYSSPQTASDDSEDDRRVSGGTSMAEQIKRGHDRMQKRQSIIPPPPPPPPSM